MAITLRTNKGSALSYEELDINFQSFFYSASVPSDSYSLSLFYTGSALQSAGVVNIPLNTFTGSVQVAGNVNELQYKLNGTQFGGATGLVYDSSNVGLAINTSSLETGEKLRVDGGKVVLENSTLAIAQGSVSSSFSMGGTTKDFTVRNHHADSNADIIFETNNGNEVLRLKGSGNITHKGSDSSLGDFVVSGSIIFGKTHEDIYRSKLFTWDSSNPRIESNTGNNLLVGNERGIILEGPQNAHVIVGVQSATGNDSFSIISAPPTASNEPTYNRLVAHFGANGNVGIGTSSPAGKLHVDGNITGSGNLAVNGTGTIGGVLSGSADLYISGSSTLSGSVTLNTVGNAATADHYDFLVVSQSKIVKQVNAAPIPLGGIIMWSGNMNAIPSGFTLCDGNSGNTVNGLTIPDLTNKFVVGASNSTGTPTTTVSGSAVATGGDISHNHGGNAGTTALTTSQIPSHTHTYKDSYFIEIHNVGVGAGGAIGGVDYVGPTKYKGSGDSDNDNTRVYWRNGTSNSTGGGGGHNHTIHTDHHVPPFLALAYIMYTG